MFALTSLDISQDATAAEILAINRCEHTIKALLGYERDSKTGLLLVKTCLAPRKRRAPLSDTLRDTCGLTSPRRRWRCYDSNCRGTDFNLNPKGIVADRRAGRIATEVCEDLCAILSKRIRKIGDENTICRLHARQRS